DRDPSFFACASRFVAYLFAIKGIRKLKPSWFTRLFVKRSEPLHSDALSVALTWLQARGEALPGALAFDVVQRDLRALRGPAYTADPEAFRGRFLQAYAEAH